MPKRLFAISAFILAISSPSAFASSMTPGGTVSPVDPGPAGMVGTKVADTGVLPFISSSAVSGTLEEQVYKEAGGTLDFYYLVSNSASSTANIGRIVSSSFLGFTTDVSYLRVGGIPPTAADRNVAGDAVGFNFKNGNINILPPGTNSEWLEISTDATTFALFGRSTIFDGGSASLVTYSPAPAPTPAPEPISMGLLSSALAAFAVAVGRRRWSKK